MILIFLMSQFLKQVWVDEKPSHFTTNGQPHWTPVVLYLGPKASFLASSVFTGCHDLVVPLWDFPYNWLKLNSVGVTRAIVHCMMWKRMTLPQVMPLDLDFLVLRWSCTHRKRRLFFLREQSYVCRRSLVADTYGSGPWNNDFILEPGLVGRLFPWLQCSNFVIYLQAEKFRALAGCHLITASWLFPSFRREAGWKVLIPDPYRLLNWCEFFLPICSARCTASSSSPPHLLLDYSAQLAALVCSRECRLI